jgi:O-antigen/teichoic acid export membrane protein
MSFTSLLLAAAARLSWRTVRELTWVVAGQAGALLASVGLTKLLASRLGVEQYGRYALAMTIAVLLNHLAFGPVTKSALRFSALFQERGQLAAFVTALRRIVGRISILVVVLVVPVAAIVAQLFGAAWALLVVAGVAFGLAQNVFFLLNAFDIAARERARAAIHQAADPAVRLAGAGVMLWLLGGSLPAALIGVILGQTAITLSQGLFLARSRARVPASPGEGPADEAAASAAGRTVIGFAKFFMLAGAFGWLQVASDRWAVKAFLDDAAVGSFAVAYQIAAVPSLVLAGCLSQFISPIVFRRAQGGTSPVALAAARRAIAAGVAALSALTVVSAAVAAVFGERIAVLVTSSAYRASGAYVAPLVLGLGMMQIGHMLSLLPVSSNRLRGHVAVKILHSVVAVLLNVFSVRAYGLPGLCLAAIASGLVYLALVMANNARIMRTLDSDAVPDLPVPELMESASR